METKKPIEKGLYVQDSKHPEHGVGRVLVAGSFALRVLFLKGGVRVFRQEDATRLRTSSPPSADELEALNQKEAVLVAHGGISVPEPKAASAAGASAANRKPAKPSAKKSKASGAKEKSAAPG